MKTYKSNLTGPELDEALRNICLVQENVEKAAGYAETSEKYGTIVEQNQAAIQAIEDNLSDVQGAAQNAADAKNAATSAAASASAASQSASDAEDAAKRAEAAAGVNPNDYYTKQQADAAFATAAQGQLAQSAVQSINGKTGSTVTLSSADVGALSSVFAMSSIISSLGGGGILDKEKQKVSLLNVDVSTSLGEQNKPYFFGSDTNSDISNAPYTSGPFYGFRFILQSFGGSPVPHLTTVIVIESYPVAGRVWGNTYDSTTSSWYGWKQNGTQTATLVYDEMAAAYNEGVASVGQ